MNADGVTVKAPGPNRRVGKYNDNIWTSSIDEAELQTGSTLSQSEVSDYWFKRTKDDIFAQPVHAVGLFFKKLYLAFHGQEIINMGSPYTAREYSWLISLSLWNGWLKFPSGLLFPLMFVGIVTALKTKRKVAVPVSYIAVTALLIAAFFACSRFRQPIIPVASVFAAFGGLSIVNALRERAKIPLIPILIGCICLVSLNWGGDVDSRANHAQAASSIGDIYLQNKKPEIAIPYFEESIRLLPDNLGSYEILTQAYLEAGKFDTCRNMLTNVVKQRPNLRTILRRTGRGRIQAAGC